jgi:hypothetical protein
MMETTAGADSTLKAPAVAPQDKQTPPPGPAPTDAPPPPPPEPVFGPRIGVRYNSPGAGVQQFVGFETFLPLFQKPAQYISFVEGRAQYDPDNRTFGGNFLVGYRTFNPTSNRILGGYISYDNRDTGNSFFHQIGAGVESLGDDWDARLNAYLPVSNTRNQLGESFSPGFFQANNLFINRLRLFEAALPGFDLEYGRKLLTFGQNGSLRGYLGFYYYGGNDGDSAVGGRLRLAARINDYAALGFTLQHDSLFDTRAIVNVALNFPTSAPSEGSTYVPVVTRLGGTVERTPGITVDEQRQRDTVVALNPTTGQAWQFIHVDLGGAGGNGTFESPFGSFTQGLGTASSGSVVYVRSGTNPGLASFTIPQGVQVLSTGPRQFLDTQQLGSVQLPLSGTGVLPTVNGTVTLSSNTGIGGFTINPSASTSAIQGTNVSGEIRVTDNVVTGTTGTLIPGIFIDNESQIMNVNIARNRVSNTTGEGIFVRSRGASTTTGTASDNETRNTVGSGIKFFTLDDSRLTATISNNFVTGNISTVGQDGAIRVGTFNNGLVNVTLLSNRLIDNETNGFFIGSEDFSDVRVIALNNQTINNLGIGIFFGARQSSKETGYFAGNYSARNRINPNVDPPGFPTGHGIFIGAQERGENNTTLDGNIVENNEQNGIFLFVANQGRGTFNVINNQALNNLRNGIEFNVGLNPDPPPPNPIILPPPPPGTLQGVANISNNTVNGNVGQGPVGQEGGGIIVIGANNAVLQATIQGNFLNSNATFRAPGQAGFAGIGMVSLDNAQILTTVRFNTILNTSAPSFNAQTAPGSTSRICLKLNFNSADAGNLTQGGPFPLIVGRSDGATFQADTSGNSGPPVIESGLRISTLGDCPVPP